MKWHSISTQHGKLLKELETIMQMLSDTTILLSILLRGDSEIPARLEEAHDALDRLMSAAETPGSMVGASRPRRLGKL